MHAVRTAVNVSHRRLSAVTFRQQHGKNVAHDGTRTLPRRVRSGTCDPEQGNTKLPTNNLRRQRSLYDNWALATGPERTKRTGLAFRIIDPFLMRASEYSLCHRHRTHLMVSKKQGHFLEYCRIVPDIAALGEPPPQCDRFGVRRNDDGDSHLAGALSVRSVESDGADRIAAKTQLALFVYPLPWPPTQLHRDLACPYRPTTDSPRCRITHSPSLVTHHLPSNSFMKFRFAL